MSHLIWKDKKLDISSPVVMGILNLTPDSFYDGGKNRGLNNAIYQVEKMIEEGASIIDLGGVSTRPNALEISPGEEWGRLKNVLTELRARFPEIILSVDTYRSSIARKAAESGIDMINDISGGQFDDKMFETIAELNLPYVMMHIKGNPGTMQQNPVYDDVVSEIIDFFKAQLDKLTGLGMTDNIILDPGFGFGKTVEHNYELLRRFSEFAAIGCPLLAGLSRKSMISKVLAIKPENALNGTTVLNTIALLHGADILRVHDVKEAVEVIRLVEKQKGGK
jgi:dihydropteroate synthase